MSSKTDENPDLALSGAALKWLLAHRGDGTTSRYRQPSQIFVDLQRDAGENPRAVRLATTDGCRVAYVIAPFHQRIGNQDAMVLHAAGLTELSGAQNSTVRFDFLGMIAREGKPKRKSVVTVKLEVADVSFPPIDDVIPPRAEESDEQAECPGVSAFYPKHLKEAADFIQSVSDDDAVAIRWPRSENAPLHMCNAVNPDADALSQVRAGVVFMPRALNRG